MIENCVVFCGTYTCINLYHTFLHLFSCDICHVAVVRFLPFDGCERVHYLRLFLVNTTN